MHSSLYQLLALSSLILPTFANPIAAPDPVAVADPIAVVPPCITRKKDDNTRELHLHRQLTDKINCSSAKECSTTHLEQNTFSYSVSGGKSALPYSSMSPRNHGTKLDCRTQFPFQFLWLLSD